MRTYVGRLSRKNIPGKWEFSFWVMSIGINGNLLKGTDEALLGVYGICVKKARRWIIRISQSGSVMVL